MIKRYEIPARFILSTETDLKEMGYLVLQAEMEINALPMITVTDENGKKHKGMIRVHFSTPEEIE